MTTKREYRSEALGAIHETMAALENIGAEPSESRATLSR
jgi:hypothetical protein